jgi:predicted TIM-barrel fold metal-dependent hydrolase
VVKAKGAPSWVIDVHAHFFNARDVPVEGYLAGPVAHNRPGTAGRLVRALAPLAGRLAALAPSARTEYTELVNAAGSAELKSLTNTDLLVRLERQRSQFLKVQSTKAYEILRGSTFETLYNETGDESKRMQGLTVDKLGPLSLSQAVQQDTHPSSPDDRTAQRLLPANAEPAYRDGVLAFVGYMLSYRWMNLIAYQRAFTTGDSAFGIDRVFGSLVDFDHWLMPPPLVAHEDQIRVHQLLSQLSNGYMRPLVAYNPWSAVKEPQRVLNRVIDAVESRGFVGIKIYPPNGFRPLGNLQYRGAHPGAPLGSRLDQALMELWQAAVRLDVPVMAHGAHTMGSDDAHEALAGPEGWSVVLQQVGATTPPRVNIGHFGGDEFTQPWADNFASLMERADGARMYADVGYWSRLRCSQETECAERVKLKQLLVNRQILKDRLMYGSDWLMLSQERRWDLYPADLLAATNDLISSEAFFGANAAACFGVAARSGQ